MDDINMLSIDDIIQGLTVQIQGSRGPLGKFEAITRLNITKPVADDTIKLKIIDLKGKVIAIALCSPSASGQLVDRNIDRAHLIREALNSDIRQVILKPIKRGKIDDVSYAVLPYCDPISNNRLYRILQRRYLRPRILRWLREATADTMGKPSSDEVQELFYVPLQQIVANKKISKHMRSAATTASERLSNGQWHPKYVIAHNDLWEGNLLFSSRKQTAGFGFVIIDWPGGEVKGHAIFDLLRISMSLKLNSRQLLREIQIHCQILNCSTIDATGYLLSSLGYMGMHLEHFPMERYVEMAEKCFRLLDDLKC